MVSFYTIDKPQSKEQQRKTEKQGIENRRILG